MPNLGWVDWYKCGASDERILYSARGEHIVSAYNTLTIRGRINLGPNMTIDHRFISHLLGRKKRKKKRVKKK
jgi:hypothetical protein